MRAYEEHGACFGNVLDSLHDKAVAEHEGEREAERRAQERHGGLLQVHDKAQREDYRKNHEAVIERNWREYQEQRLPAHDEHEERHLNHVRDGVYAACGIGTGKTLENRPQYHKACAGAEPDDAVENCLQPVVVHERDGEHRDGGSGRGKRDEPGFDEALGSPAGGKCTDKVTRGNDEHRYGNDRRVEHVVHALDEYEEYLRYAPEGGEPEDGEPHDGVAPGGGKIAHGGAHLELVVRYARADEEGGKGRKCAEPEVNPERKVDAYRGIGAARKPHREKRRTRGAEHGKRHVPRVYLHEVLVLDDFLHYPEFCRSEDREEHAV